MSPLALQRSSKRFKLSGITCFLSTTRRHLCHCTLFPVGSCPWVLIRETSQSAWIPENQRSTSQNQGRSGPQLTQPISAIAPLTGACRSINQPINQSINQSRGHADIAKAERLAVVSETTRVSISINIRAALQPYIQPESRGASEIDYSAKTCTMRSSFVLSPTD